LSERILGQSIYLVVQLETVPVRVKLLKAVFTHFVDPTGIVVLESE